MESKILFLISANPELLREALNDFRKTATVEAEFGDVVIEGSEITLAHHGSRANNPCPCLRENSPVEVEAIGLSHIDLDAFGGLLSIMGIKPKPESSFWKLAAFIDLNGPHKLTKGGFSKEDIRSLNAYWAFNQIPDYRTPRVPRKSVLALTWDSLKHHYDALCRILDGDEDLLRAGDEFAAGNTELNQSSFDSYIDDAGIVVRVVDDVKAFVNHLYDTPDGKVGRIVVTLNLERGAITLSAADPIPGFSCGQFLKDFFGPEAGGHAGIGGSPRNLKVDRDDLNKVISELSRILPKA